MPRSSYSRSKRRRKKSSNDDLPPWAWKLIFWGMAAIAVYVFVIAPIVAWVNANLEAIKLGFTILAIGAGAAFALRLWLLTKKKKGDHQARLEFTSAQAERGLEPFVDTHGVERWGTPAEVQAWEQQAHLQAQKDLFTQRVVDTIREFKPSMSYAAEIGYHAELIGWVKQVCPDVAPEEQRGSSRPDIVVKNRAIDVTVAIEVKGPTRASDLQTLADKCARYSQHFDRLIIVLFDVQVREQRYRESKKGLEHHFPGVHVIRIDAPGKERYAATCSDCKEPTRVPFKPDHRRPVYCLTCWNRRSGRSQQSPSRMN